MKKGLIIAVAVLTIGGVAAAGGYKYYQEKEAAAKYEEQMAQALNSIPPIVVYEHEDLPAVEEVFAGTEKVINLDSVQPDISNVSTDPGTYTVTYAFTDSKGIQRTTSVACEVKPDLAQHVQGMTDISIDEGEDVPTTNNCEYDEYVDSVTMNTDMVDNTEAGVYDISYTVLGVDGEMKNVDGYKCTVNDIPEPTPTPTPNPTATPKPKKETKKKVEKETTQESAEDEKTGNVTELQDQVVETGDNNNILAIVSVLVACIGAAAGAVVYRKKTR